MRTLEEILDEYAKKQAKARAKAEQEERAFFEDNAEVLSKKNEMRHAALAYMKDCRPRACSRTESAPRVWWTV